MKAQLTYEQFVEWAVFLNSEETRITKLDLYLAQIAAEVRRGYVKEPKKVKVSDFLVGEESESRSPLPDSSALKDSKSVWMSAVGHKKKKKV